jgi:hypothetical protein
MVEQEIVGCARVYELAVVAGQRFQPRVDGSMSDWKPAVRSTR